MKTMTVGEFKTHFSEVLEEVKAGNTIEVTYGKKKDVAGYFSPKNDKPKAKRVLGILEGKGTAEFAPNFKMTLEEFLGG